ncbi:MAG: rod shape-determining protein MreD [Planctomycetes bacterium]|nr:rod shape-determining protein MreD [Planctomycetota bacterium]
MRWLTFLVCAAVLMVLQTVVAPRVELFGARPDWLLMMVVFYAMHGTMPAAAIGAWGIGACADLMTLERPGLIAMSYLLVAILVALVRDFLFRLESLTQFVLTFTASLLVQTGWYLYRWGLYGAAESALSDYVVNCLLASVYTAGWAVLFHKALLSRSRLLGIGQPKYRYTGLGQVAGTRV